MCGLGSRQITRGVLQARIHEEKGVISFGYDGSSFSDSRTTADLEHRIAATAAVADRLTLVLNEILTSKEYVRKVRMHSTMPPIALSSQTSDYGANIV